MSLPVNEIVQYIRKTFKQSEGFIPLHAPIFFGNEKKYVDECIDTTFVSSVGQFVDSFELEMAKYTGVKRAVACVNGTNALHLALVLAGVEADSEVITQPLTFIATANAISYCGAKPVFIDVDLDTFGLSPDKLEDFLSKNTEMVSGQCVNKHTKRIIKACVPMHTFGHPCKIDKLAELCLEYGISLVEDAAESIGSLYNGQHTGSFSKIGVLSFNGNKTITTGGGGMLLFSDEELAQKAKHLSTQAKIPHPWSYNHDEIGYNYRMPNINAALGLAQLEKIDFILGKKRQLANQYITFFNSLGISFFVEPDKTKSNYWLNTLILADREERDFFLEYTNSHGVMTRPAWELMTNLPMFSTCECGDLSNAAFLVDRIVNLPSGVMI
jgi:aminotransferase in exopolysaccharide biosynthesis